MTTSRLPYPDFICTTLIQILGYVVLLLDLITMNVILCLRIGGSRSANTGSKRWFLDQVGQELGSGDSAILRENLTAVFKMVQEGRRTREVFPGMLDQCI